MTSTALRRGIFYGWWIVVAGFVVQMFTSGVGTNSVGVYLVVLQEEFGWSKAFISGAFALAMFQAAALAPFQGRLVDRFGPRAVVRTGIVIMAVGLMTLGLIYSQWQLYVSSLLIGLGFTLAFDVALQTAVVNWFRKRRGTAMGLMMAGAGAGGVLVPGVAMAVQVFDWRRAVLFAGIILLVVGVAAAQFIKRSPEEYGLSPDGETNRNNHDTEGATTNDHGDVEFTVRQALRTPAFWFLALGQALVMFGVTAVGMHLVPHASESLGLSLTAAGSLMTVLTVCIVAGHVGGGFVADKVDKRKFIVAYTIVQTGVLALLVFGTSLWVLVLFAVAQGLIVGARAPLNFALRADYFGRKAYGTIWGVSLLVSNLGNMAGMIVTGYLADRSGSYQPAFIVLMALTGLAVILLAMVRRPARPAAIAS
jgi:MFS family permease